MITICLRSHIQRRSLSFMWNVAGMILYSQTQRFSWGKTRMSYHIGTFNWCEYTSRDYIMPTYQCNGSPFGVKKVLASNAVSWIKFFVFSRTVSGEMALPGIRLLCPAHSTLIWLRSETCWALCHSWTHFGLWFYSVEGGYSCQEIQLPWKMNMAFNKIKAVGFLSK